MCGIVGVVGNTNATDILIQGLEKLEYRGYDSAGVFLASEGKSQLVKAVGRIAELSSKAEGVEGTAGLDIPVGPLMENQLRTMPTHTALKQVALFWSTMGSLKTTLKSRKNT